MKVGIDERKLWYIKKYNRFLKLKFDCVIYLDIGVIVIIFLLNVDNNSEIIFVSGLDYI